jgi:transposase
VAQTGRPKAPLTLTDDERAVLERWARRPKSAQALALRSKIVLACADGTANKEVAARLGVTPQMVGKWRARFVASGLDGLADEPRPGQPRKITDEQVEEVIVKTLEAKPPNQDTHWSTRSMAKATGLNQTAVSRIWRTFGLKPHVQETWKLSTDPQFIEKVRDVVGLYLDPPEHAVVLCVDEKTQIQAIDRTAPCLPILPTALNVATGQVIASHHRQHRQQEFLKFLKAIDAATPAGLDLHLICDNYATHKTPAVKNWLLRHPRFHIHFVPTSSSWLNLVERWFAELTNRKLRRSAHRSVRDLEADIQAWIQAWNDDPRPFVWTKTADQILESIASYLQLINDSGH